MLEKRWIHLHLDTLGKKKDFGFFFLNVRVHI
jgi:hypothetical protein